MGDIELLKNIVVSINDGNPDPGLVNILHKKLIQKDKEHFLVVKTLKSN